MGIWQGIYLCEFRNHGGGRKIVATVMDEEQKFGVSVKEKLRQLKVNVDTLTMTATPIPRTLQFSLMGARDLSFIQTPVSYTHLV